LPDLICPASRAAVLSLAPIRYRNVLASHGGPIEQISLGEFPVCGRRLLQANARLTPGLIAGRRKGSLYSDADGTGTAASPMLARFKAVSEAIERWAFHVKTRAPDRELYGFDLDESSNGMAAYPGLTRSRARRHALLEAVERASLFSWWEGIADGEARDTDWPGVKAVMLPSPIQVGLTVVAYKRCEPGFYAYGHAAGENFGEACERAVIELARNEFAVRRHRLDCGAANPAASPLLFEQRCLFFATEAGYALFEERLHRPAKGRRFVSKIVCDTEVSGPWTRYATVWRVVISPPSDEFLSATERYFFW
jgi:hypothetical protein